MDITALGLSVDSRTVVTAEQALDRMAASGARAETAVDALERSAKGAGPALGAAAAAATAVKTSATGLGTAQTGANRSIAETVVQSKLAAESLRKLEQAEAAAALAAARSAQAQAAQAQAAQRNATAQAFLATSTQKGAGTPTPEARAGAESAMLALAAATARAEAAKTKAAAASAVYQQRLADVGKQAGLSAVQMQQLGFQVNDFLVQIASGGNPLTAFIQQGSQLSGTFGGVRPAFQAVMSLLSPLRLALGGVAAAVVGLGVAWAKGNQQSADFAKALQLTGNFAGQTEGQFTSLTRSVAEAKGQTVSATREIASALLATGEIGPQAFRSATEAAVGYAAATGKTAEDVARDFAAMARAPSKFALEANRQLNFLTAAQYQAIKGFEETGRTAQAQGVILDALNQRFARTDQNLGTIERTLLTVKSAWSSFWDAAFDIGRAETIEDKIEKTQARIESLQRRTVFSGRASGGRLTRQPEDLEAARIEQQGNLRRAFRETENAFADAQRGEVQKAGIAADAVVESYLKRSKSAEGYAKKLAELNAAFKAREDAGIPVSQAERNSALAQLRKDFTDSSSASAAVAARRAQLEADLQQAQDRQAQQVAAYARANALIDAALQARLTTEADYFDAKRTLIEGEALAEENALIDQQARIEVEREALERTKGGSKEIIDLRRQEAEIEARLQSLRADTASKVAILDIQRIESARRQRQAIDELRISYEDYFAAVQRANTLEAGLVGRGDRQAQVARARLQIEDRFRQAEEDLNRRRRAGTVTQDVFAEELAIIREAKQRELAEFQRANDAILREQGDWANGMTRALENYLDSVRDLASQVDGAFTNAFRGAEDVLTDFFTTGKADVKSFATSIVADINRIIVRQNITGPLAEALQGNLQGGGALADFFGGLFGGGATTVPGIAGGQIALGGAGQSAAARATEVASLNASTIALNALTLAANTSAQALGQRTAPGVTSIFGPTQAAEQSGPVSERDILRRIEASTTGLEGLEDAASAVVPQFNSLEGGLLSAARSLLDLPNLLSGLIGNVGGGAGGLLSGLFSGLFMSSGGRPPMGRATVVGENGYELFVPDVPGRILSHDQSQRFVKPRGGDDRRSTFNITQNFEKGATTRTADQSARQLMRQSQIAAMRGTA
jgi:lambda family phage tail tape measure protein